MKLLTPYLTAVEEHLKQLSLPDHPANLYEPIRYFLTIGGKRMRPVLVLMGHQVYDPNFKNAVNTAMAVELFHNFTLIHDDIMDEAPLRRGKETVHKKWNENIGILSGDVLLVYAYQHLIQTKSKYLKDMIELFNKTAIEVCEGQQMDMDFESRKDVSIEEYLEMIRLKTAVLVGCSLELGALAAGVNPQEAKKLYDFGQNLGVSFQLKDDFLDVYADQNKFGKQVGGDILSNKKTYLLLKAIELSESNTQQGLKKALLLDNPKEKIEAVTTIYNELEIPKTTENKINEYFDKAINCLNSVDVEDEKKAHLYELAVYLLHREN